MSRKKQKRHISEILGQHSETSTFQTDQGDTHFNLQDPFVGLSLIGIGGLLPMLTFRLNAGEYHKSTPATARCKAPGDVPFRLLAGLGPDQCRGAQILLNVAALEEKPPELREVVG